MLKADSRFAPSQWEMALFCNDASHWLAASLESALYAGFCCGRRRSISSISPSRMGKCIIWIHTKQTNPDKDWCTSYPVYCQVVITTTGSPKGAQAVRNIGCRGNHSNYFACSIHVNRFQGAVVSTIFGKSLWKYIFSQMYVQHKFS